MKNIHTHSLTKYCKNSSHLKMWKRLDEVFPFYMIIADVSPRIVYADWRHAAPQWVSGCVVRGPATVWTMFLCSPTFFRRRAPPSAILLFKQHTCYTQYCLHTLTKLPASILRRTFITKIIIIILLPFSHLCEVDRVLLQNKDGTFLQVILGKYYGFVRDAITN